MVGDLYLVDADTVTLKDLHDLILAPGAKIRVPEEATPLGKSRYDLFLFLTEMRTKKSWNHDQAKSKCFAANEFLIRTLRSYGLARLLYSGSRLGTSDEPTPLDRAQFDRALLARWIDRKQSINDALVTRLKAIQDDVSALLSICDLELPSSDPLYESVWLHGNAASDQRLRMLLEQLGALHQLGRYDHVGAEGAVEDACPWLSRSSDDGPGLAGRFQLERALNTLLESRTTTNATANAERLAAVAAKRRLYEVLRDFCEWLAIGAFRWGRAFNQEQASRGRPDVLRMLIVDELLNPMPSQDHDGANLAAGLKLRLKRLADALKTRSISVEFDHLVDPDGCAQLRRCLDSKASGSSQELKVAPLFSSDGAEQTTLLATYHVILVEIDHRNVRYVGPSIVQKLGDYFDRFVMPDDQPAPTIMVLSQASNLVDIQQCLNLGAPAYVRKDRIYELPARVVNARILHNWQEPLGRRSNFRSLYSLPSNELVDLQSRRQDELILGRNVRIEPDEATAKPQADPVDRQWLWRLPKADLHCHFGTLIDLDTIQALALNSVGHVYERRRNDDRKRKNEVPQLESGVAHVIDLIRDLVELAGLIYRFGHDRDLEAVTPIRSLLLARDWIDPHEGHRCAQFHSDCPLADIVRWLRRPHRQLEEFEVTSLLVARIALVGPGEGAATVAVHKWRYFQELFAWSGEARKQVSESGGTASPNRSSPAYWLAKAEEQLSAMVGRSWRRAITKPDVGGDPGRFWLQLHERVVERVKLAAANLGGKAPVSAHRAPQRSADAGHRLRALAPAPLRQQQKELFARNGAPTGLGQWIEEQLGAATPSASPLTFSLQDLVVVPEKVSAHERTLLTYLRGAALLGADHLQYPENLLLAARSVVAQATDENVWYSELRCESIGYAMGGMSALDATDLLCTAFTLASAFAGARRNAWSQVNILLGAKRHKSRDKIKEIVALLSHYLQRSDRDAARDFSPAPPWWRPCRVVGFDLSGDESKIVRHPERLIRPLLEHSAPITIHAGEAATAQSIWRAVYEYGARRIGHGLRLREDKRLLEYCVSEGICLEFCPISNSFTTDFAPAAIDDYHGDWREHYPLRYYLDAGLDVCICTDNRQLHARKTLTAEYMRAAELVGGLTRWEVLRMVKAGFKHAFLPKDRIEKLLTAVEDRVYDIVTAAPTPDENDGTTLAQKRM